MPVRSGTSKLVAASALIGSVAGGGFAQDPDLARYFGFADLEVIKIGDDAGPITAADMNGDGLLDLIAANNHDSRIEVHLQRRDASPDDPARRPARVNQLPEHWRFDRLPISVTHFVASVVPHDFDADGLMDLIYVGMPNELVFVRQTKAGSFAVKRRHRVKHLFGNRDALAVTNLIGDDAPELVGIAKGSIQVWPMEGDVLGAPTELNAGAVVIAFFIEDFNGDGRADIAGIIPDDPAPLRVWFGAVENGAAVIGSEVRFEMAPLLESAAVRLPGERAARIAAIERASKRVVVYTLSTEPIEETGDRDAALRVQGFPDGENRDRQHAVVDLDGDGLLDLVATDTQANALVTFGQRAGKGLQPGVSNPSMSDLKYLVAGNVDDDATAELFVLSEDEAVVGRCDVAVGPDGAVSVPFPRPIKISMDAPKAMNLVRLESGPHLAVVVSDGKREYAIDLIDMDGGTRTVKLGKLSRSPQTIVAIDADQDGATDLLLFTPDRPMAMLAANEDGFELIESKDMGQYGLVQAARAENGAVHDVDGDGKPELLIADQNYVRAVRYDPEPGPGISPGWQVVRQINARDGASKLISLAIFGDRIVAADKENSRLVVMASDEDGDWREAESLTVRGFELGPIHAGAFSGDSAQNVLAIGAGSFAVVRLAGDRIVLEEAAAFRTPVEQRIHHEFGTGDVNGDGFTDLVVLDAGEQMCEIFTFSEAGKMLHAASFQVFESLIFSGGGSREYEPSQVVIADVTGDGADDLILLAHDRVLVYPQMARDKVSSGARGRRR